MKSKKNTKVLIILFIIAALCFVPWKALCSAIAQHYYSYVDTKTALPESGTYYCAELQASVIFQHEVNYVHANGTDEQLLFPFGSAADFCGIYGDTRGTYFWDQKNDYLEIIFSEYPAGIETGRGYVFSKMVSTLPE